MSRYPPFGRNQVPLEEFQVRHNYWWLKHSLKRKIWNDKSHILLCPTKRLEECLTVYSFSKPWYSMSQ
jgi:hypothetical protein